MDLREFVIGFRNERDAMLAIYAAPEPSTYVGTLLREADLDDAQREKVIAALGQALTDTFYTILLGLDGCASIGGVQQGYRIQDESGTTISVGNGELEAVAFEEFQER